MWHLFINVHVWCDIVFPNKYLQYMIALSVFGPLSCRLCTYHISSSSKLYFEAHSWTERWIFGLEVRRACLSLCMSGYILYKFFNAMSLLIWVWTWHMIINNNISNVHWKPYISYKRYSYCSGCLCVEVHAQPMTRVKLLLVFLIIKVHVYMFKSVKM